ncbi:uncharacterized protein LOC142325855 [Lycorma delicatula]|uniref:uncharacterized protein LOC142318486 n=1 Tax=Lycorma delicatula TaxID=130591 RepID=UPI003F50EF09
MARVRRSKRSSPVRKGKVRRSKRIASLKRGGGLLTSLTAGAAGALGSYIGDKALKGVKKVVGKVVNKGIDLLPIELHIPGYQYCGPGTNLKKRLKRGDPGVNKLDAACKEHDIAYATYSDNERRAVADRKLADSAWERVKAKDSSIAEKATALAVTNAMKLKAKFGGGRVRRRRRRSKRNNIKRLVEMMKQKAGAAGQGLYLKPYPLTGSGMGGKKKRRHRRRRRRCLQ